MAFWNRKKYTDIDKPVTNPALKNAFKIFFLNKCEETLQEIISKLKSANFLVLIETDGLNLSKIQESDKVFFEKGSTIKFLKTFNENHEQFLPIFTDWNEIDLWVESRDGIAAWIMPISDAITLVFNSNDAGLVINPCSDKWDMNKEQISTFLKESE